jgi:hypothetical protein
MRHFSLPLSYFSAPPSCHGHSCLPPRRPQWHLTSDSKKYRHRHPRHRRRYRHQRRRNHRLQRQRRHGHQRYHRHQHRRLLLQPNKDSFFCSLRVSLVPFSPFNGDCCTHTSPPSPLRKPARVIETPLVVARQEDCGADQGPRPRGGLEEAEKEETRGSGRRRRVATLATATFYYLKATTTAPGSRRVTKVEKDFA